MRALQLLYLGLGALLALLGFSVAYLAMHHSQYPQAFYSLLSGAFGLFYGILVYTLLGNYRHKKKR